MLESKLDVGTRRSLARQRIQFVYFVATEVILAELRLVCIGPGKAPDVEIPAGTAEHASVADDRIGAEVDDVVFVETSDVALV